jgi:hypothetical protein
MSKIRDMVYALPIPAAVHEMILEGLRLALFAALSALLTFAIGKVSILPNPEMWMMVFTFLGRMLDKWKYESAKELKIKGANTGVAGF